MKKNIFIKILILLILSTPYLTQASKLVPTDNQSDDYFGIAASISGNYAIVGAKSDDDIATNSGSAYIYKYTASGWQQVMKLLPSDGASSDYFGGAVSMSGDYAIIGAMYDDVSYSNSGSAYIFKRYGNKWFQETRINASDLEASDYFGQSVSISGNYAIVGAYQEDTKGSNSGAAYIFKRENHSWNQLQKITASDGAADDQFAYSVHISGNYAIVGSKYDDDYGTNSGSAYIFVNTNDVWTQAAKINAMDGSQDDYFGYSVHLSGNYAIVGSPYDDTNGLNSGSAHIFERTGTNWTHIKTLMANDRAAQDFFGNQVSISNDYALVSAYQDDDYGSNSGSVYVFKKTGSDWVQWEKISPSDATGNERFGSSIDISDGQAVIGAFGTDDNGDNSGAVHFYTFQSKARIVSLNDQYVTNVAVPIPITVVNDHSGLVSITANSSNLTLVDDSHISFAGSGTNTITIATVAGIPFILSVTITPTPEMYTQSSLISFVITDANALTQLSPFHYHVGFPEQKLLADDSAVDDQFGYAVSISGNHAIVGARYNDEMGTNAGAAYIYSYDSHGWRQSAKITAIDGGASDYLGYATSISDDYAIIGAYADDDVTTDTGAAYVYQRNGTVWTQAAKLIASDGAVSDYFGIAVDISDHFLIVGAYRDDHSYTDQGSVYIFQNTGNSFPYVAKLLANDPGASDYFGRSVAISGNTAIVGAYLDDDNGSNSGSAYIFVYDGTTWTQQAKLCASDGEVNDYFGFSVGISEDYAIVGAYYDDDCGSDCGAAYIFKRNATVWSEFQKITAPDAFSDDRFGYEVEINNTHAMIGAINTDDQGINSGSAYLYAFNGSSWIFKEKFSSPHESPGDEFGFSVSLSDHHAMIGALYDDTNNANSGSAYIYQLSSSPMIVDIPTQEIAYTTTSLDISITIVNTDGNNMTISAISSDTDIVSNDNISIAASGLNTYAASTTEGTPLTLDIQLTLNNFENGASTISILVTSAQGATHTNQFKLTIKPPEQKIYPDDLAASDNFGCAVSISGDFLIAGAQYDDDLGTNSGSAYIYKRTANGWQLMEKLQASDGAADDRFGYNVALSGDYAIVSAHYDDVSYDNSGAAYIFRRFGNRWYQEAKIYADDRAITDYFGHSVDIHNNYAIIGSIYEDHNYTDQGSAYIFEGSGGTWTQVAKLMANDRAASDHFGSSVAIYGDYAIVGARYDDDKGSNSGSAYIFKREGASWTQQAKLTAFDGITNDYFGNTAVDINENFAIVGCYNNDSNAPNSGAAYIFLRDGSSWNLHEKITAFDGASGDNFGYKVALSGQYAIIGAQNNDDNGSNSGSAYIYKLMGSNWMLNKKLTASDAENGDSFGYAVSISDHHAVIAAVGDDTPDSSSGSVYVYELSQCPKISAITNFHVTTSTLINSDPIPFTLIYSNTDDITVTAMSSNITLITSSNIVISGAANNILNTSATENMPLNLTLYITSNSGQFGRSLITTMVTDSYGMTHTQSFFYEIMPAEQKIIASDGETDDRFATDISISDHYAIVGAHYDDDIATNSGTAYIFSKTQTGWTESAKLSASDAQSSDYFGYAVSISGDFALVGANGEDEKGSSAGAAYIFNKQNNRWIQTNKLVHPSGASNDQFGYAVFISGDYAIVGSIYDDYSYTDAGTAFIYKYNGATWIQQAFIYASDRAASDQFGCAVAICDNYAIVGARYDDDTYSGSGSAYIFFRDGDNWNQQAKLTADDPQSNDYFGFSVAISDDYAFVGAYADDHQQTDTGSVYIFKRSGTTWSQTQKITPVDGNQGDYFGFKVSVSNDYLVLSSEKADNQCANSGIVYLYQRDGESWNFQYKLTSQDPDIDDYFGRSVSIHNNDIAIGAFNNDDNGDNSGSAYFYNLGTIPALFEISDQTIALTSVSQIIPITIFHTDGRDINITVHSSDQQVIPDSHINIASSGSNTLVSATSSGLPLNLNIEFTPIHQTTTSTSITITITDADGFTHTRQFNISFPMPEEKVVPDDGAASDQYGHRMSISGDFAIVSARYDDDKGSNSGSAYILQRKAGGWQQMAKLVASDGAADDQFGLSVAISGDYAIVSAPYDDVSNSNSGSAYIFKRLGSIWYQEAKIYAGDRADNDYFGHAVDIDDKYAIIGSIYEDHNYTDQGSAYIFERDGANWTQVAKIMANDRAASDHFGSAVAIDGNYAIVGSRYDDDKGSNSGSAYIFKYDGTNWTQEAKLTASDGQADDRFGEAVSIQDDIAIIGAFYHDTNLSNSGAAYIFKRNGTSWTQMTKLTANDPAANDYFGHNLELSSQFAIVGAYGKDSENTDTGVAYIFKNISNDWVLVKKFTASDSQASDYFGHGISISDDYAAIGAHGVDDSGTDSGSSYFYELTSKARITHINEYKGYNYEASGAMSSESIPITIINSNDGNITITANSSNITLVSNSDIIISGSANNTLNTPTVAGVPLNLTLFITSSQGQCGQTSISLTVTDANGLTDTKSFIYKIFPGEYFVTASDGNSNDYYGYDVAISNHHAIVGAHYDDDKGSNSGSAYILSYGETGWSETTKLSAIDGAASDYFGYAVDISGDYALVGAYYDDDKGSNSGSAYIFKRQGSHWVQSAKLLANNGAANDYFGYAVAISGDYAIIGSYYDDNDYTDQGTAYIFKRQGSSWFQDAYLTASDKAASDLFGCAVDIFGTYAIVGAKYDDDSFSNSGSAYIFFYDGSSWSEQAKLTASDPHADDYFGVSVSISGDYAIVGAYSNDLHGSDIGAAYIFKRNGTTWSQTAALTPTDGSSSDNYGYDVSISGDYAIIGSKNDDDIDSNSGTAYVYQRDGESWNLLLKLMSENGQIDDHFGHAVAIYENNIAIGSYYDDDNGSNSGSASIFMLATQPTLVEMSHQVISALTASHAINLTIIDTNGSDITITAQSSDQSVISDSDIHIDASGSNTQVLSTTSGIPLSFRIEMTPSCKSYFNTTIIVTIADADGVANTGQFSVSFTMPEEKVVTDDAQASDQFCNDISIFGDFAIAGAVLEDHYGSNSGSAYILQRKANGWQQIQKILGNPSATIGRFGQAVAMHDDYAIVGAWYEDVGAINSGAAYIFRRHQSTWHKETSITPGDRAAYDYFGHDVDIYGNFAIVGSYQEDNEVSNQGAAYIFQKDGASWTQIEKLTASDRASSDNFGFAVSMSGNYVIIGARYDDDNGANSGSAYIFQWDGTNWSESAKLTASDGQTNDYFGSAVSILDDMAIVGAYANDANTTDSGAAYIFQRDGSTWTQITKLTPNDPATSDLFGYQVDLSSDFAIVGAYGKNSEKTDIGAAYIFKQINGDWVQVKKLMASDNDASDQFGYAVSISNDFAGIGSIKDDDMASDSGASYFYKLAPKAHILHINEQRGYISGQSDTTSSDPVLITIINSNDGNFTIQAGSSNLTLISNENLIFSGASTNTLNTSSIADTPLNLTLHMTSNQGQYGKAAISLTVTDANGLTDTQSFVYEVFPDEYFAKASDGNTDDYYGYDVGISNHHAIVGAYYDDDKGSNSDSAYILTYGDSGWSETAKLSATDGVANDYFGYAVDISGDYALIGAYYDDDKGSNSGSAYIFKRQGSHWVQSAKLLANNGAANDYFGYAVSLSGDNAIIGAYYDDLNFTNQGTAYIFKRNGSSWIQEANLVASDSAANDYFGCAVDISGDYVIVGAKEDDDSFSNSGSAYIFVRNGTTWSEQAKLTASDAHASDYFGFSVSISGRYAIVGAYSNDLSKTDMGAAYIFKRTGTTWSQTKKLTATDGSSSDNYGYHVSISGDYAIVGSKNDDDKGLDSGSAYVYQRDGESWNFLIKLTSNNGQPEDNFGHAVDIYENNIAIGSYYDDDNGNNSGSASIFMLETPPTIVEIENQVISSLTASHAINLTIIDTNGSNITITAHSSNPDFISTNDISIAGSGSNTYVSSTSSGIPVNLNVDFTLSTISNASSVITFLLTDANGYTRITSFQLSNTIPEQKLYPDDAAASDNFGNAIDIFHDHVIVGSRYDDDKGSNSGSAYIFQRNASGWNQMAKLTASDGGADDHFGYAVSIFGDYAIVGARYYDVSSNCGAAYIFKRYGNHWQEETIITASDKAANDYFGNAVDITKDFAVVGAYVDDITFSNQGSVYVFKPDDGVSWTEVAKIVASDGAASDDFGFAVSISGETILAGAPNDDDNGTDSGSAYIFQWDGTSWSEEAKLTACDGAANDYFGYAVSLSGDTAIIGAYKNESNTSDSGAAYIFKRDGNTWNQITKLTASDGQASDYCGYHVSISDNYAIVGAYNDDDAGTNTGAAYIFKEIDNNWTQIKKITASDASASDLFGSSVSISNGFAAIGALQVDDNGSDSGACYIYNINQKARITPITDQWVSHKNASDPITITIVNAIGGEILLSATSSNLSLVENSHIDIENSGKNSITSTTQANISLNLNISITPEPALYSKTTITLIITDANGLTDTQSFVYGVSLPEQNVIVDDGALDDDFAMDVSIHDNYAIISSYHDDDKGANSGSAYIYTYETSGWKQSTKLVASDGAANDEFAHSVAIYGDFAVVGARYVHLYNWGAAYFFKRDGTNWTQLEKVSSSDIANYDFFGFDVDIYGNTAMISATGDADGASDQGAVYVFQFDGTHWNQQQKLVASDFAASDFFGWSIDLIESYAIIGAYYDDDNGSNSGSAYIFHSDGTTFSEQAKITASDGQPDDEFGFSVAMSENYAVIGAHKHDAPDKADMGAVYIYERSGTAWSEILKITPTDGVTSDQFGYRVAISGDIIAVSSLNNTENGANAGAVYLYKQIGASWDFWLKQTASDGMADDNYASGLALSESFMLVGANKDEINGIATGSAYFYAHHEAPLLVEMDNQTIHALQAAHMSLTILDADGRDITITTHTSNETIVPYTGINIAGSGNHTQVISTIAGETLFVDLSLFPNPVDYGTTLISFMLTDADGLTCTTSFVLTIEENKLMAPDGAGSDYFGNSLDLSGDHLIVGAYYDDDKGTNSGAVYLFQRGISGFQFMEKLVPSDGAANDYFGYAVSVSGDYAIVGAYLDDHTNTDQGAVYIYKRYKYGWYQETKIYASNKKNYDHFGDAVSINGNKAIVGASSDDETYTDRGSAFIFVQDGADWIEEAKLFASDAAASDNFGCAVSLWGNYALIGAYNDDDNGSASGSAYIFKFDGTSWIEEDKLMPSDGAANDQFGYAVSLSGDYAVFSAHLDDDNGADSGAAYIFKRDGTTWSEQAKLTPTDAMAGDQFGYHVSISDDLAIVGARYHDDTASNSGAAYLFQRNGTTWSEIQKYTAYDAEASDYFGTAVALDNGYAVCGSYQEDTMATNAGATYVYPVDLKARLSRIEDQMVTHATASNPIPITIVNANSGDITITATSSNDTLLSNSNINIGGTGSHTLTTSSTASDPLYLTLLMAPEINEYGQSTIDLIVTDANGLTDHKSFVYEVMLPSQKIAASDGADNDDFGYAVAISGNYAVIGGRYDDDIASNSGAAFIYQKTASGWIEKTKLLHFDGADSDFFGYAVSISGDHAIIGAHYDDDIDTNSGSAYIFSRKGDQWIQSAKLVSTDSLASDYFGNAVSISGDYAIIGANYDDHSYSNQGSAYIYKKTGNSWLLEQKLYASDAAASDYFGRSVFISGDYAIVGAQYDDDNGTNSGSAYIFKRDGTNWTQQEKLLPSDGAENDYFGFSVSISNDYAIIGAYGSDNEKTDTGSAYIFKRDGTSWSQAIKLTCGDASSGDNFGYHVSISNTYAIVGSKGDDDNGPSSGSAYVYKRNGTSWELLLKLKSHDGIPNEAYGFNVAISDNDLIIGVSEGYTNNVSTGTAYIYSINSRPSFLEINNQSIIDPDTPLVTSVQIMDTDGRDITITAISSNQNAISNDNIHIQGSNSNTYVASTISGEIKDISLAITPSTMECIDTTITLILTDADGLTSTTHFEVTIPASEQKIIASDGADSDYYGYRIAMSGDYAIVGAYEDDDNGSASGSAYMLHRNANGWYESQKILAGDGAADDQFGFNVDISGDYAIIGARYDDYGGTNTGSAYIFRRVGNTWFQESRINASDKDDNDYFGYAVSISGNYAIVGAYADDDNGSGSGSSYIFKRDGASWSQETKIKASDGAAGDDFGYAVSIYGDYAIVGAKDDDDYFSNTGSAYIFKRNGTSWTQEAKLTASDVYGGDDFGIAVSISNDYAIVGSQYNDAIASNSGAAYIFKRDGSTWNQVAKIVADDGGVNNYFGRNVAIRDDYAIVAAYGHNLPISGCGAVYLFKRVASDWIQIKKITASDAETGDNLGAGVAIDNGYAFVSSRYDHNENGSDTGAAYFYEFIPKARLTSVNYQRAIHETAHIPIPITLIHANGGSVSLSAITSSLTKISGILFETADYSGLPLSVTTSAGIPLNLSLTIMPAPGQFGPSTITLMVTDANGLTDTQIFVYDVLPPVQKIVALDGESSDNFGISIDISGNTLICGAKNDDDIDSNSGAAYIFQKGETGWRQYQKLTAIDGAASDYFGNASAISGKHAIVGAYYDDDRGSTSGSAYIFTRIGKSWIQSAKLLATDGTDNDRFGYKVGISGNYAIVGAYRDDSDRGSAYIFHKADVGWVQQAKLTASSRAIDDYFGYAVSISGNYAIVGAYYDDDNGSNSGSAYIFKRDGSNWSQQAKLVPTDGASNDYFGYAVAISGDFAIVGANNHDGSNDNKDAGAAYIYQLNGTTWSLAEKLTPYHASTDDDYGYYVDISENFAIVGAEDDDDNGSSSGSAYVYQRDDSSWNFKVKLTPDDGQPSDYFGFRVAVTDDYAASATSNGDNYSGINTGSAYIYTLNSRPTLATVGNQTFSLTSSSLSMNITIIDADGRDITLTALSSNPEIIPNTNINIENSGSNSYVSSTTSGVPLVLNINISPDDIEQTHSTITLIITDADGLTHTTDFNVSIPISEQKVIADDGAASDYFGYRLAMSGDYAIVGAYYDDDNGSNSGSAYMLHRNASGWYQTQKIVASDGAADDRFGYRVDMSGDYAIVGAYRDDYSYSNSGSAYIFRRYGNTWIQETRIFASDRAENDYFGISVAISGEFAIVGAYADDDKGTDSGSAYIFKRDGASWIQVSKVTASDGAASDQFGVAVSINGDYAIVGAHYEDYRGSNSGSAYIFKRSGDTWSQETKITALDGYENDHFGYSVDIADEYAIVGSYDSDTNGINAGSAYIFKRSGTTWTQAAKIISEDLGANDCFGQAVSISGDYAIVSGYSHDLPFVDSGVAYVFKQISGQWITIKKLSASDSEASDNFGIDAAMDNGYAIVGARYDDDNASNSGAVYFYPIVQKARLTSVNYQRVSHETAHIPIPLTLVNANGGNVCISATTSSLTKISSILFETADSSGFPLTTMTTASIPLNMSLTIIPAPDQFGPSTITLMVTDANGLTDTQSFIYDVLPPVQKIVSLDADESDYFARSLDISGNTIICGAHYDDDIATNSGAAYIFQKDETGWSQYQKLTAIDGAETDYFGYVSAISGKHAIVGAYYDDDRGSNSGSAYIFTRMGSRWLQSAKLLATDGADNDRFGYKVDISGNYAIVGSYKHDSDRGSAYIFHKADVGLDTAGRTDRQ